MKRYVVGKTVVSYPEQPRFVLIDESGTLRLSLSMELLAAGIHGRANVRDEELRVVKNSPPDIIWRPDDTLPGTILECTKLSPNELHELARLLRK